jgi:hypothetical protein
MMTMDKVIALPGTITQADPRPTVERLHELFNLDAETGVLRWRWVHARGRAKVGDIAGCVKHDRKTGYCHRSITINRRSFQAHVIVWAMTHGEWPDSGIEHIDRNALNDSPDNLRLIIRKATRLPSVESLHDLFDLDVKTGVLKWKAPSDHKWGRKVGDVAGCVHCNAPGIYYRVININYVATTAHRIVWAMTHNVWPTYGIDHINHNGLDNRPSNLRKTTASQNLGNQRKQKGCSSDYKGVHWIKASKTWKAKIEVNYWTSSLVCCDEITAALTYDAMHKLAWPEQGAEAMNFEPSASDNIVLHARVIRQITRAKNDTSRNEAQLIKRARAKTLNTEQKLAA